jgi:hypothetical protein
MKDILIRALIKLTSVKTWLLIWSCFLITAIVLKDRQTFNNLAMLLVAVPISYFPSNIIQKIQEKKKDGE